MFVEEIMGLILSSGGVCINEEGLLLRRLPCLINLITVVCRTALATPSLFNISPDPGRNLIAVCCPFPVQRQGSKLSAVTASVRTFVKEAVTCDSC